MDEPFVSKNDTQSQCLKQKPSNDISQFHGLTGAQLAGSSTVSLEIFQALVVRQGWTIGATPCGLYLYVTPCPKGPLHMASFSIPDFPHGWLWGYKWRRWEWSGFLSAGLANLRVWFPPQCSGQSSHGRTPNFRGEAEVLSLEGKAEMSGAILCISTAQL